MNEKKERMIFDVTYQPQVRTVRDTQRIMLDVIIATLPIVASACTATAGTRCCWSFRAWPPPCSLSGLTGGS